MRFAFTDDQLALRDAVRDLLAKECPPDVVRAAWPAPDADGQGPGAGARADATRVAALWGHLAEMGVLGVAVPEEGGGLGMDARDWVLVAEEVGYAAVPLPFSANALVVAPLLAALGDPSGDLAALVGGGAVVDAELTGSGLLPDGPWHTHTLVGVTGVTGALDGSGLLDGAGVGAAAGLVRLVPIADLRARADDEPTVDGAQRLRRVGHREVGGVELFVSADELHAAFDRGALATAAELVGLTRRMLDLAVAYVVERRQFGVPIGSFQAVKHHLADARLRIEFAAPAVYRAAWSVATDAPSAARDVSMAKVLASEAAHVVGRKALQVHGGIGYTVEYDLHLFLKRAWALQQTWGTDAFHRDRVGRALGI